MDGAPTGFRRRRAVDPPDLHRYNLVDCCALTDDHAPHFVSRACDGHPRACGGGVLRGCLDCGSILEEDLEGAAHCQCFASHTPFPNPGMHPGVAGVRSSAARIGLLEQTICLCGSGGVHSAGAGPGGYADGDGSAVERATPRLGCRRSRVGGGWPSFFDCAVPTGLGSSIVAASPTLKRGANERCAHGASLWASGRAESAPRFVVFPGPNTRT